jgi:SHS2 domain-containing protein
MAYTYLDHTADIGIRAEGESLEDAFASGVEALLNVIFDLSTIDVTHAVTFSVTAKDPMLLFVEVLNEALSIQDTHGLAFKELTAVEIKGTDDGGLRFIGTARGEPVKLEKHTVKTEVKGATYSGLSYSLDSGKHVFECVVDI